MYAEDDAVAKLDGYVISVAQAGALVGKKTLVRIENVGRSAASATLVEGAEITDAPVRGNSTSDRVGAAAKRSGASRAASRRNGGGSPGAGRTAGSGDDGKASESKPRRRGRRGGRGRRRASSDKGSSD